MVNLNLEKDEGIIIQTKNVERYQKNDKYTEIYEMYLTNKHLIYVYEKVNGMFSKTEDVIEKVSLNDIKIAGKKIQIFKKDDDDYGLGMQVFFKDGSHEHFLFEKEKEIQNWIDSIKETIMDLPPIVDEETETRDEKNVYCSNCGEKLKATSKFCNSCGSKIGNETQDDNIEKKSKKEEYTERKVVYEGDIHKCPNCGELVNSFDAMCPACGHELNSKKVSSTLKEFIDTINEHDKMIAKDTPQKKGWKTWGKGKKALWVILNICTSFIPLLIYFLYPFIKQLILPESIPNLSMSEKETTSIIENYAFPKDRESVLDAMVFIKSKMAFLEKKKFDKNTLYWSNLWSVKAEELYKLGKIIIKNDKILESTYNDIINIKNQINKNVKTRAIICGAIIIVYTIFILLTGSIFNVLNNITGGNSNSNETEIVWLDTGLMTKIPEIENKNGHIWDNNETELNMSLEDVSYKEFEEYITECKSLGYSINSTKDTNKYLAYNNDGYNLDLSHIGTTMYIKLYAPLKGEENFEWPTHQFASMIPKLDNKTGAIKTKEDNKLEFNLYEVEENEVEQYITDCENTGFSVDSKKENKSFEGFNSDGYKLTISYNDRKVMTIIIESPMKLEKISWPTSGPATMLPNPSVDKGKISIDFDWSFSAYVEMNIDEYNNYIEKCIKKGFKKDYRTEHYFTADKGDDVNLTISYEGFNIVYISINDYNEM